MTFHMVDLLNIDDVYWSNSEKTLENKYTSIQ